MLAALVLTRHDNTGRQMGNACRRLGRVDVLTARSLDRFTSTQIRGIDLDADVLIDLRETNTDAKGSVAPVSRIEG